MTPLDQLLTRLFFRASDAENISGKWLGKRLHLESETESQVEQNPLRLSDVIVNSVCMANSSFLFANVCNVSPGADSQEKKGGGVAKGEVQDVALQEVLDGWTL